MAVARAQLERVELEACRCPGKPHPADEVFLKPHAGVAMCTAAWWEINRHEGGQEAVLQGALRDIYLALGIDSWSFVDGHGRAEPVNEDNIARLLPPWEGGMKVANRADELYGEEILAPLARRLAETAKSSPATPTELSTSASPSSGSKRRPRSARSSRNGSEAGKPSEDPAR